MPSFNRSAVEVWKLRFRRLYTGNSAALAALTADWASDASEVVSFTSVNLEGGAASGVVTGNRLELLAAAEELLADPVFLAGVNAQAPRVIIPDFSACQP